MLNLKIFKKNTFLIYSLGLWGAQVVILFVYTLGFKETSQLFTIPYRVLVVVFSIYLLFSKSLFGVFIVDFFLLLLIPNFFLLFINIISHIL